ncbi:DUF4365 domain-containing protein [Thermomonas carbonis]|uniref:DUF4365 domain-containing protein n=1 Tax=Thermomonas carbonis TaxID=1463158 RepID=A0A7G9SLQ2_9GAMM|nr:DUF4365 domain-containing protein [Thermomonas carbonis]QNN68777.1 DUF4365 domain-containing protein [Thermomonas carbonis]GHC08849.1 hypothetical protein GCM10010080_24870 [Thermomonas carbonis]
MKYPKTAATGHAGEFFFAYQVAKVLGWPCRIFDIDIGVDAQVEVLNAKCESTGKFVAFQIKTTAIEGVKGRYVDPEQLAYWKGLEHPVFLVLVDLEDESMYLHRIDRRRQYPKTKGGLVHIAFDRQRNRFGPDSERDFSAAADEAQLQAVEVHLDRVRTFTKDIEIELARQESAPDPRGLIEVMRCRSAAREHVLRAEALVRNSGVGLDSYQRVELAFERALGLLRHRMCDWNMEEDWDGARDGDGDIRRFLDEGDTVDPGD